MPINCRNIYDFFKEKEKFGKEARLYYKGNEKKTTDLGFFLTLLYFFSYLALLIIKLIRMLKKVDFKIYDSFEYIDQPPSIKLSNENFYGGFALEYPETYDPFIDETIYFPKAYFKNAKRSGDKWIWDVKEVKLERCNLSKFGPFFQDKFNKNALNNLYCFKEMNETLIGHFSYDNYSFFYIQFFPCINTTENNNHCKPTEVIDYYLTSTFICMEFEDVELTPQNNSYPVKPRNQDIYFTVGKKLFKEIHIFYQIVNIETDLGIIGIEELEKSKKQQFLKYHSTYQMSNLIEDDIYKTGEPFCDVTIKLHDQVRIQKRIYSKLLEVWGEVGGIMEVIELIIDILSFYTIDLLYDLSIVNNLFSSKNNINEILKNNTININEIQRKSNNFNRIGTRYEKKLKRTKTYKQEISIGIENIYNNSYIANIYSNRKNAYLSHKSNNYGKTQKIINYKIETKLENSNNTRDTKDPFYEAKNSVKKIKEQNIDKILINRALIYLCCCFVKQLKNTNIFLFNNGINFFIEKMDIFSLFKMKYVFDKKFKTYNKERKIPLKFYFLKNDNNSYISRIIF